MWKFIPPPHCGPHPKGSWFGQIWLYTLPGGCFLTSFSLSGLMVFEKKNFLKWQQFFNNKKTHLELSAHADELKMIWYNHSKFYRQLRTLFNSLNSITVLSVTKIPSNNCKYHNIPVFCCSVWILFHKNWNLKIILKLKPSFRT